MYSFSLSALQTINQILTAGVAVTAFSLLLYALAFNLRDRVARSFAIILICVVIVFVGDAIGSVAASPEEREFWLLIQWVGIVFLPPSYLHFSDALLGTTGRPARGWRRILVRLTYLISLGVLLALPLGWLVGPLDPEATPAPHLERTWLTWVFTGYYLAIMALAWLNFWRSFRRTVTSTSQRRMKYLLLGAIAPALGSYPYLLFGSAFAAGHQFLFWLTATLSNAAVWGLLIVMAYAVAFFGVPWPDRVVKRRLFKWLMRGPITGIFVLAAVTLVRRAGESYGLPYTALVPVAMVGTLLICEYLITLAAPLAERWLFQGGDHANMRLLQTLEERVLTSADLRQFLEAVLAAVCDRLQTPRAFVASLGANGVEMLVTMVSEGALEENLSEGLLEAVNQNGYHNGLFTWGNYWLIPLYEGANDEEEAKMLGLLGAARHAGRELDPDQRDALTLLARRAATALEDRQIQQLVVSSLEALTPQVDMIQRLRAAARYDGASILAAPDLSPSSRELSKWVKEALTHYWGGPRLTESPLLNLRIVQKATNHHEENPVNALRAVLKDAIDHTRPEGERRFTGEWILYNILEMKFLEGRKVREIAIKLAMSEADLYRKQRVAIESVANAILEMEQKSREEH